jgi:Domain of unknown function (DUF3883)
MSYLNEKTKEMKRYGRDFDKSYQSYEANALAIRGQFLRAFPLGKLGRLTIDKYAIGSSELNFCKYVEIIAAPWAGIKGSTAIKFGIYYGRTKSDEVKKYRYPKKFANGSDDPSVVFLNVKKALLELIKLANADSINFELIDKNPLSQMFKAKILSLYFPEKFINICSGDHLKIIADALQYPAGKSPSKAQYLIAAAKRENAIAKAWSNPKFMSYLYDTIIREEPTEMQGGVAVVKQKKHRKIDFEKRNAELAEIGEKAEKFAYEFECNRLAGMGIVEPENKIQDRRDRPAYGYDYESQTQEALRYIEVKAVGRRYDDSGFRFFLSDNEYQKSQKLENYYFYLVYFDKNGPSEVHPIRAKELYPVATISPKSYEVAFD